MSPSVEKSLSGQSRMDAIDDEAGPVAEPRDRP